MKYQPSITDTTQHIHQVEYFTPWELFWGAVIPFVLVWILIYVISDKKNDTEN